MLVIAHVSDTHFGNDDQDPTARTAAVMDHLLAMDPRPDVVVVSGDVADHGLPEEYAAARSVLDTAGVRFVLLDSLVDAVDGERIDHGELGEEQLGWLDQRLAEDPRPTYVVLHHPPTTISLELMDPIRLRDGDALAAVLARHSHVAATLVGHAHTMAATTFADRPLMIGGGVVSTVTADAESPPTLWYDAPASFALHLVEGGRVTTHWRALPG